MRGRIVWWRWCRRGAVFQFSFSLCKQISMRRHISRDGRRWGLHRRIRRKHSVFRLSKTLLFVLCVDFRTTLHQPVFTATRVLILERTKSDHLQNGHPLTIAINCQLLVMSIHNMNLYTTDAGRNFTLSATRPSSIRNLETMASDYMRAFRRESTTALSTLFNPSNIFVQHHENAFTETVHAHAPYHVIYAWGQIFDTYLKSLTPICLFTEQLVWLYN